jgi:hypothetical protein
MHRRPLHPDDSCDLPQLPLVGEASAPFQPIPKCDPPVSPPDPSYEPADPLPIPSPEVNLDRHL